MGTDVVDQHFVNLRPLLEDLFQVDLKIPLFFGGEVKVEPFKGIFVGMFGLDCFFGFSCSIQ